MFTNIFGKGYLKFANFFFKNSVIQINKDTNIISINSNKSSDSEPKIFHDSLNEENILQSPIQKKMPYDFENTKMEIKDPKNFLPIKKYNHILLKRIEEEVFKEPRSLSRNRLRNRVCEWHISANDPREDRSNSIQLKNLEGFFVSVYDGHGGDSIAKLAKKEIHKKFDQKILSLKFSENLSEMEKEKIIRESFNYAFDSLESEIYKSALDKFYKGESKFAYVGCCVLCVIVHNNLLITANLGDCKAVLYRREKFLSDTTSFIFDKDYLSPIRYFPIKLSSTHNARKEKEKKKFLSKFRDKDIIVDTIKASYIKGRLQPTRSLGDLYLKHKEFNNLNFLNHEYKSQAVTYEDFNGPYIDHLPEINSHYLSEDDEYLILATDGLWDLLNSREVCEIITENEGNKLNITDALRRAALSKAAMNANLNLKDLLQMPKSLKRSFHDDISIMVVDLKNQVVI